MDILYNLLLRTLYKMYNLVLMNGLGTYLDSNKIPVPEFACEVGVEPSCIYHYLSGRRKPRPDKAMKMEELTRGVVPFRGWYQPNAKKSRHPSVGAEK